MMMFPRPNETDEQFSLRYDKAAYELELMAIEHDKEMRLSDPTYSRFHSPEDEAEHLLALVGMKKELDERIAANPEEASEFDDLDFDDLDLDFAADASVDADTPTLDAPAT
jgi:isopentenyldiphosphate isomerase